jgi:hypothetical protein
VVLNVSGFKVRRTIEFDPKFMDPEYPFRWAGVYHLTGEFYDLRLHGVPFPKVKMVMLSLPEGSGIDELRDDVTLLFSGKETHVPHGSRIRPGRKLLQLQTKEGGSVIRVEVDSPGRYVLSVEKSFEPHQFALCGAPGTVDLEQVQIFKPDHERSIP